MKRTAEDAFMHNMEEEPGFTSKWFFVDADAGVNGNPDEQGGEPFVCGIEGCIAEFFTEKEFRRHCRKFHRHVCSVCKRNFSTSKLLSMHLLEKHDNYFKEQAKVRPMYQCFADDCSCVFSTAEEREYHAIREHHFSPDSTLIRLFKEETSCFPGSSVYATVLLHGVVDVLEHESQCAAAANGRTVDSLFRSIWKR